MIRITYTSPKAAGCLASLPGHATVGIWLSGSPGEAGDPVPDLDVGNLSVTLLYEFRAWPQLVGVSVRTSELTFLCSQVTNFIQGW